jgi:hypothetical protein
MEVIMADKNIAETQRLIKFIERLPFTEEEKTRWLNELHENGFSGEVADEVHQKFLALDPEKFGGDWERARDNIEITGILRQWRLSVGSKNFHRGR